MTSRSDQPNKQLQRELDAARAELRKSDERRQEAEQRRQEAEQQRQEAEQQRQAAEQREQAAEQRRQLAEETTQRTTLKELLRYAHEQLSRPLVVQTDKSLSTKGSITSAKKKLRPRSIRPWIQFPALQQEQFDLVYHILQPPDEELRLFSPRLYIEELGRNHKYKIASERDVEKYEGPNVESFVTDIIARAGERDTQRRLLESEVTLLFENHANTLNDLAEDVADRRMLQTPSSVPLGKQRSSPDRYCVFANRDGVNRLILLVEYKAPHKMTIQHLRAGVHAMELEDVINRAHWPVDCDQRFQEQAELLVSAAVTQTFSYMIEEGVEYGYITTGESILFLWIKGDDPQTVYVHLAEPNVETDFPDDLGLKYPRTAIAQILSLCLMALNSNQRSQQWRNQAKEVLHPWDVDYEAILRQLPEEDRQLTPASAYKMTNYPINKRSPYFTRRRARQSCQQLQMSQACGDDPNSSASDGERQEMPTPTRAGRGAQRTRNSKHTRGSGRHDGQSTRSYCTHACLLGLVNRSTLDSKCPNHDLHRRGQISLYHDIDQPAFCDLLRRQLHRTLDDACTPLGLQGSRGALFKITLMSHGYTIVAKGTVKVFVPDLRHEAEMYQHLQPFQGRLIPVFLGSIDLHGICYFMDVGVQIIHFVCMSWVGETRATIPDWEKVKSELEKDFLQTGFEHRDLRQPNVIWNQENSRYMAIDFERSWTHSNVREQENKRPIRRILQPRCTNAIHSHGAAPIDTGNNSKDRRRYRRSALRTIPKSQPAFRSSHVKTSPRRLRPAKDATSRSRRSLRS